MREALLAVALFVAAPASADEPLIDGGVEEAWQALKRLPPRFSWEFALATGYGDIPYWRRDAQPSLIMGGRASMGWHFEDTPSQRLGLALSTTIDGPVPIHFAWVVEPAVTWDSVTSPIQIGLSLGPALSYNAAMGITRWERKVTAGPSVAMRLGYSEPWSRVGRRFHVLVEPKLRYIMGPDEGVMVPSPSFTVLVGSGLGR